MPNRRLKKLRTGVFIDGANLFWGMKDYADWRIDFTKLKGYLKKRYSPLFYNYYACEDENPTNQDFTERANRQKAFHRILRGLGYEVKTKSLKHITDRHGGHTTKGDMDVEISVAIQNALNDIDLIVFLGGDSDFLSILEDCHNKGKYIRIYSFEELLSWELKTFGITKARCAYKLLDELKDKLEYRGG